MKREERHRQLLRCCRGMTLVEIMVAMVIVSIIAGIVYNVSLTQMRSVNEGGSIMESSGSPATALELIKRDLALAGYGTLDLLDEDHQKNIAFLLEDGGTTGSDKLYLFDGSFIDVNELAYDFYGELGFTDITSGSGGSSITLERLDLDNMTSKFDNAYDDNDDGDKLDSGEKDEFKYQFTNKDGNLQDTWQYVITNTGGPNSKVGRITDLNGNILTLDQNVVGDRVGPAVYYCVDLDGTDANCKPAVDDGERTVLRRSSRDSSGIKPVAENIVDIQVAYKSGATWYSDGSGNGPMNPFYAGDVDLIRISLVARIGTIPPADPTYSNVTSVENGPVWGNDGFAYRVYTVSIRPRNNIEFN